MSGVINVGLVGFGLAGRVFHGPVLSSLENVKVKAICTANTQNEKLAKLLHPGAKIIADPKKIFSDKSIDLAVIATPNTSHYDLAASAIKAGKHVVVDKPFMITAADADKIIEMAAKKGVVLSVFQNRRWDGDFITLKKVLQSGLLGEAAELESRFDGYDPAIKKTWRNEDIPGSGKLYDLGSHLIDQAVNLFGNPTAVTADVGKQRKNAKIDDHFTVILHFQNGIKATLRSSQLVLGRLPKFVLIGQNGTFVKYGTDVQESELKAGKTPVNQPDWGREPEENRGIIRATINGIDIDAKVESAAGDYREYYRNVIGAIQKKEELIVTPQQARNTVRLIEYAVESSERGMSIACDDLI